LGVLFPELLGGEALGAKIRDIQKEGLDSYAKDDMDGIMAESRKRGMEGGHLGELNYKLFGIRDFEAVIYHTLIRNGLFDVTDFDEALRLTGQILEGQGKIESAAEFMDLFYGLVVKRTAGATWLFAVAMRDAPTRATFTLTCVPPDGTAEVLDEERTVPLSGGVLTDDFAGYDVHLYRLDG
jgi:hypothetical protein